MSEKRLSEFLEKVRSDLDRTVNFWVKHSHDTVHGGFFNCIDKDGKIYDETKHVWLQARQVWMYARLYKEMKRFQKPEILEAAIKGAEFLQKFARNPETYRCYFALTKEGKPVKIQRTIFSECFYLMAMSELGIVSGKLSYKKEALTMMDKIVHWVMEDDTEIGRQSLDGAPPHSSLAVPMMMLCIISQIETMDNSLSNKYSKATDWAVAEVFKHVKRDGTAVLENVGLNGSELTGSSGRLMTPGHSIEAGWFLLDLAIRKKRTELAETAIQTFMINPYNYGWDKQYGGLYYFLDVDGWSPAQLEWDLKLWWPHNEAMISFLMAYKHTKNVKYLDIFAQIFDYSYSHFVDNEQGEWYGYLDREGKVKIRSKGGVWKGCFHVPRALMMCEQMLEAMTK
ncbi:N-acylglucosamine 2-epimerase-like [Mytilus californianus]|uniref:N-acylglucosamine 2-epimerase-like n=1 Tax=Mytilus californianus TaxID=6549 RepID=UPI0022459A10|nr:N-acylglucosamine 2-epimerase-like [Mytilus californianus]XP_052072493.1 N-acylglucosamine 2-epimerase-like [Mytilus californianus]XP_052072498.1 N-acylglucosamine 2-epimerase-like [Mytilus californianus]XP_052072507.1 N-acylglucosamine 2-epimerase-like [Mytilus californianus]